MKKMIELFSGSGKTSKTFAENGYEVQSVDVRFRKNTCEPTLRKNILDLNVEELLNDPFVVWAGVPCDVWSYAAGNFHWKNNIPATKKCLDHIALLDKTIKLLRELNPRFFFIENPRGRMRFYRPLLDFLEEKQGVIKTVTLSAYGFPTQKPTSIFTNLVEWNVLPLDAYGRGAKAKGNFNNMTKVQRQSTPVLLIQEIIREIESKSENRQLRMF